MGQDIGVIIAILMGLVLYFVPFLIAASRDHHRTGVIFIINLFLGWTFLGWVVALAWGLSRTPGKFQVTDQPTEQAKDQAGTNKGAVKVEPTMAPPGQAEGNEDFTAPVGSKSIKSTKNDS